MKVAIYPVFRGVDSGEGGIRQVVEAMKKWLPEFGIDVIAEPRPTNADLVATHAGVSAEVPPGIPWVSHCHGLYWQGYEWDRWCYDMNQDVANTLRMADHTTAPSEWVANALRRGMWLRPTVLYHGIDPDHWEGGTNKGYVLWNKNRADPICDPTPVMEVARRTPGVQFISTFGREGHNLQITGRMPYLDAAELIRDAGVYLCTTRETFGVGTLEALASGVPVVGWNWGGQREIIKHGVTGWLVNPGDYDGLQEGIEWALDNRSKISAAAIEDARTRWTWKEAIGRYAELYRRVYEEKRARWEQPKVSVVIPAHNLGRFLPDTIRSLQSQTLKDWEAIIVDDESTDETPQIAAALAAREPRIKVMRNDANLYLAGTLNAGMKVARGRYLLPLDSDNMLAPTALDTLANALDRDRKAAIVYGAVKFVLEDGVTPDSQVGKDGVSGWPQEFSFQGQMLSRNQIPSTAMYRREVWERTGGYRRRWRTAEDADFWTRAVSYGFQPKKATNGVTLIYRQREDSMSRVNELVPYSQWYPWTRFIDHVPFGAAGIPPEGRGVWWEVPSYEPVKVSVIIPVGPGHEALLIDALDSLEAQVFRDWEAIVINDTGHPLDVPHPWVTMVESGGNIGVGAARNMGLKVAKAPAILFLDADDYLQAEAIDTLYSHWLDHRGVIYSGWWDDFGDEGTKYYEPADYSKNALKRNGALHAVTAMYSLNDIKEVGGFDPNLPNWEDWDLQIALDQKGVPFMKVALPLFTYRKTTGMRREENYSAFDRGKDAIMAKWPRLWDEAGR